MDDLQFKFEDTEINQMVNDVVSALSDENKIITDSMIQTLIRAINQYLNKVMSLQNDINSLTQQQALVSNSVLKKNQALLDNQSVNIDLTREQVKNDILTDQILKQASEIFKSGYYIVMRLREFIMNEKIQYHVAIEGGKTATSMLHAITEEQLLDKITIDTYRLSQAIANGESILSMTMRYNATKKYGKKVGQEEGMFLEQLPKTGSTLWSKGYRVYKTVRDWYNKDKENRKGYGINFGHFLEAYYASGGNPDNRKTKKFNSMKFLQLMLNLQNSVEFYKGGDSGNIQLKSNSATITSLNAIYEALLSIRGILVQGRRGAKKKLKELFSPPIKSKLSQPREIPKDLQAEIKALEKTINA